MAKLKVGDMVTVKLTSPQYRYYGQTVGIIETIMLRAPRPIIVNFTGLKCSFRADELQKV